MKILGFEVGKKKEQALPPMSDTEAVSIIKEAYKKSSEWSKIWLRGQDPNIDSSIATPYKDIASVFKAVKAICDNIPQAQPSFYNRKTNEEVTEELQSSELIDLFRKPNARQSFSDFIQEWVGYYSLYGEGFIQKIRSVGNATGARRVPLELFILNPKAMTEVVDDNTRQLKGWRYSSTSGNMMFTTEEIIHTKDFNPYNFFRGLAPLSPIADEMKIDQHSLEYNLRFFMNDATPSMVLSSDKNLTPEQRKRLDAWWNAKHQGTHNAFNMEVLENGMKANIISQTHRDMDFIEQKKFTREELLGIWKAPKALFNITDDLNYATFQGQMKIFWIYTLMPIMRKFEDSINSNLVTAYDSSIFFKFNLKNVPAFQEDFSGKVATAQLLVNMGEPLNKVNEKLDLGFEEVPWGDDWWVNGLLTPATDVMNQEPIDEVLPTEEKPDERKPEEDSEDEEKKSDVPILKSQRTVKQLALLKAFGSVHNSLQSKLENKIKRLFYDIRKQAVSTSTEDLAKGIINIDWVEMDKKLRAFATPVIEAGIKAGAEIGKRYVGKSLADEILNSKLMSYLAIRIDNIVRINKTTEKRISDTIKSSIAEGQSTQQIASNILALGEKVREDLKRTFNSLASRARTIAVTETSSAVNGGSFVYYKEVGVTKKQWITSHDELVRHSHSGCEKQGELLLTDRFSNGLMFPSDQDGSAGEIINCRCTLQAMTD